MQTNTPRFQLAHLGSKHTHIVSRSLYDLKNEQARYYLWSIIERTFIPLAVCTSLVTLKLQKGFDCLLILSSPI